MVNPLANFHINAPQPQVTANQPQATANQPQATDNPSQVSVNQPQAHTNQLQAPSVRPEDSRSQLADYVDNQSRVERYRITYSESPIPSEPEKLAEELADIYSDNIAEFLEREDAK